ANANVAPALNGVPTTFCLRTSIIIAAELPAACKNKSAQEPGTSSHNRLPSGRRDKEAYAKRNHALNEGAFDLGFCDAQASFA
ncbi:hypothetical protein, partial [Rathayibacter iranicus]|uniref:hypothetical protein n=1 Tax=Rathayibacter iranicus TaxID=59737 RepID=UPI001F1B5F1F